MHKHSNTIGRFFKKYGLYIAIAFTVLAVAGVGIGLAVKSASKAKVTDKGSSSSLVSAPVESEPSSSSEPEPEIKLTLTNPTSLSVNTRSPDFTFAGSADKDAELTLNGERVPVDQNGFFSIDKKLNIGKNTFTFLHKGESVTYTVNYRYVVIDAYSPKDRQSFECGSVFGVSVKAREGAVVTAEFRGQKINLTKKTIDTEKNSIFKTHSGSFSLPDDNRQDLNLGKIKFTACEGGITESFYSGDIICKKKVVPMIAEVVHFQAETFDAYSTDDESSPLNNYLPRGTVDYVKPGRVYYNSGSTKKEYAVLRYGKQVYTSIKDNPGSKKIKIIKEYEGTLPDHNEIRLAAMSEEGKFTTLNFSCLFKAPFTLQVLPQKYQKPSAQNYSVSAFTSTYVDITFCYATVFEGEIAFSAENPLFKEAQIIKEKGQYVLRLHLKKQGGFYGWDAYYNEAGELCFKFLHPARVEAAENACGADLTGVKIVIDAGHNGVGVDVGALGFKQNVYESDRNLLLANKLKERLEAAGATVIMTRSEAVSRITLQERIKLLKAADADLCISVHHDSSESSRADGFAFKYGLNYSYTAANEIFKATRAAQIYSNNSRALAWHYFFLARTSNCPVVLTENGFMSNQNDFSGIISDEVNNKKADAIAKGVGNYFLTLNK